ncbi:hypothetical protein Trydic_g16634 [Trypoxylus dichotomus]
MEKFGVPEPQWILDKAESGWLFWRREPTGNNARVKFRDDVEVVEFCRSEHELEEVEWPDNLQRTNGLTMSMAFLFCIAITILLPCLLFKNY